ncbi:MAG: TetR/AcrR family transcriptional regulator [Acidimicrobiia bacterium]|nr:TetR/AcrR family transcriptional regulator [Acidimicrobiia bacterium]
MSAREHARQANRQRVLDAVLELVAEGGIDEVTVPAVARRSEISVATIYRYFPTKDALLDAAAARPAEAAGVDGQRPGGTADLDEYLHTLWSSWVDNLDLLRRQSASTTGREMRRRRLAGARATVGAALTSRGIDPDSTEGRRLVSLLVNLTGSLSALDQLDRQGLEVDEAVTNTVWAVEALIDATLHSLKRGGSEEGGSP